MSSLWTPSGEHRVGDQGGRPAPTGPADAPGGPEQPDRAQAQAEVEALRRQLAESPAETVVANHCYGLFELAAVYLSADPPQLAKARLAIDALGLLVDGLGDRLGEATAALRDGLTQLRLGYVQVDQAVRSGSRPGSS